MTLRTWSNDLDGFSAKVRMLIENGLFRDGRPDRSLISKRN